ncbi:MAG: hypothetical protein Q8P81_01900 [Nanoarchaeota archaeon]|nr:hypothetical protein [Nanoarchaeota archaeon]
MAEDEGKRTVSLGFERPEELDEGTIYIDFFRSARMEPTRDARIIAVAYSNGEFTAHAHSISGSVLTELLRYTTSEYEGDSDSFVRDIVTSNDGILDYSRLIKDGSLMARKMRDTARTLETLRSSLELRVPNRMCLL